MKNKMLSKLSLKKETITKLKDHELKKFVGGLAVATAPSTRNCSCVHDSCSTSKNDASCMYYSCNCPSTPSDI